MNSQLIRMESAINGYNEGIALDASGYVSEGSGENLFVVRDGKVVTPPLGASVLPGITRDTILQIARSLEIPVVEALIPREMLYIADELFFCGTAVEVTPVRSVDRIVVGNGKRGPITERLQREFFAIVEGQNSGSLRMAVASGATGRGREIRASTENQSFPREPNRRPPPPRLTHWPSSAQKS